MSKAENDILFEKAKEVREYFTGTLWEKLIDKAYKDNDLERLRELTREAEREMLDAEYRPEPKELSDDEIESIARDSITIDWGRTPF